MKKSYSKRGTLNFITFSIVIFLAVSLISFSSAGFSDWYNKITGKATSGSASVNITIGNNAPTISYVEQVAATDLTEGSSKSVTFNFTATDTDGASNLNSSSATASFTRAGEPTRSNTSCVELSSSGNDANYSCTVDMWYFDENGAWDLNVTIKDVNDALGSNDSLSVTFNLLTAMVMTPSSLTWTNPGLSDTNIGSNNDPVIINNTGNAISLSLNVTAYDLQGEVNTNEYIDAANFTVENESQGCSGTAMVNATSTNVTSAILQRGNNSLEYFNATSGQEQLYFCLKGLPQNITAQSYSSQAYGSWTVFID